MPGTAPGRVQIGLRTLLLTAAIMAATTVAAFLVRPARGEVSGALIFVLGITLAGSTLGLESALLAATVSFLLYNFYFAEPVLTFRFDTLTDLTPLVVFNLSAVISGLLAGRLRDQARATVAANASLRALLQVSHALQSALTYDDIREVLLASEVRDFGVRLLTGNSGPNHAMESAGLDDMLATFRAESGDERLELIVSPPGSTLATEETLGSALANLVALAMERAALSRTIAETQAQVRLENLKSSLLSSVSHDLRTPLTTISASASSLIDYGDRLEPAVANTLLRTIVEESERLNRFTSNLLELTRLEGGQTPPGQILSVSDLLASSMRRVRNRSGGRIIERIGKDDAFVLADAALFELALLNVLENAILYSDDGSRITVAVSNDSKVCTIDIADEGRGIPSDQLERVFDRFYRVDGSEQMPRGTGLGLAIAKGFVQAWGGTIAASVPGLNGRGSRIRVNLPLALAEQR